MMKRSSNKNFMDFEKPVSLTVYFIINSTDWTNILNKLMQIKHCKTLFNIPDCVFLTNHSGTTTTSN